MSTLDKPPTLQTMTLIRSLYPTQRPRSGQIPQTEFSSEIPYVAGTDRFIGSSCLRDSPKARLHSISHAKCTDSTDGRNYGEQFRTHSSSLRQYHVTLERGIGHPRHQIARLFRGSTPGFDASQLFSIRNSIDDVKMNFAYARNQFRPPRSPGRYEPQPSFSDRLP